MRLNSLTTKNYRTLEDLTLQFSKNYCTISGKNNAGKLKLKTAYHLAASGSWRFRHSEIEKWIKRQETKEAQ